MIKQERLCFILVFFFAFLHMTERLHGQKDNFVQILAVNNFLSPNKRPALRRIRDKSMKVGKVVSVSVSVTDPDGDDITLSWNVFVNGRSVFVNRRSFFGTFLDHGNGTGTITFNPTASDVGVYKIVVVARDDGQLSDEKTFTLTVCHANGLLKGIGSGFMHAGNALKALPKFSLKKLTLKGSVKQKLSGPGPFVKLGATYNIFELSNVLALNISASFGVSLQNDLDYGTEQEISDLNTTVRDFSFGPGIEFGLPKDLRVGIALVIDRFSGDRFDTFTNKSFALSITSPELLWHLRFGVIVHHYDLNAMQFGAIAKELGPEIVPELVIRLSF